MKKFLPVLAAVLVSGAIITLFNCAILRGYASNTKLRNGVVVSAGKVDWLSLSATIYSRDQFGQNSYETVHIYRTFKNGSTYYYENGNLWEISLYHNSISDPKLLTEHLQEAKELLVKTREKFSDIMPPQ